MQNLPVKFLSAEAARALDERTIASGTPGLVLMKRAAAAVARETARAVTVRPERAARLVLLAGPGTNGGDGFEAARLLQGTRTVTGIETLLLGDPARLTADAQRTFNRLVQSGLPVRTVESERDLEPLRSATFVLDALFGTGLTRPIGDGSLAARAVALVRSRGAFVLSVDVPSGLSGDRDDVPGPSMRADATVTFGAPKRCHVFPPAAGLCGRIVVADIGLLGAPPVEAGEVGVVAAPDVAPHFPRREATSHKGTYGHLLVAGGSEGFRGAPALAARAAHRSGAGLVTVAAEEAVRAAVHALSPETTSVAPDADLSPYDALAVGPGLGRSEKAARLLKRLAGSAKPAVFDADALNLSGGAVFFAGRPAPTILTPHPGEAARLLGTDAGSVNADRIAAARRIAALSGAVVVLKGFRSVVCEPAGRTALVLSGNPGMASGGTGDVLTGMAGAFLARGLAAWDAAAAAAWLHGAAGDLAAERVGEEAVTASDVTERIGAAFSLLSDACPA